MPTTTEEWKSKLSRLTAQERAVLARFLIDSLDPDDDAGAERAWDAELARRAEDIRQGTAQGEPAETVMDELREKYS